MKWPVVSVCTPDGPKEGIAPQIISASRATDIPAFHAQWLVRRLEAGYCKWVNPFNRRAQYVSFQNARAFVFWTKNAQPLIEHLPALDRKGIAYYFQFTLNEYEAEGLEPNVPPLAERVRTFARLSDLIGRERVIWRFDPLVLTDALSVGNLARKIERVGDMLHPYTEKLVISFADIAAYAKVRRNLAKWPGAGTGAGGAREFRPEEIVELAARVSERAARWGLTVATCCEGVDLTAYGIAHNRCVDAALLLRISGNDPDLARLFGSSPKGDSNLFARDTPPPKDPGQRANCGCAPSKDIGAYNTCPHLCAYCYANTSPAAVLARAPSTPDDDAVCP